MVKDQKISLLKKYHHREWVLTRRATFLKLSDEQPYFCCCGRLATGRHELNCSKFQNKVDSATVKKLYYLLPKGIAARKALEKLTRDLYGL